MWVGGNIGHPLLCEADGMLSTDFAVLELSSFQLMTMTQSPHIAVVTNLAPNHLDVHRDMAEYVAAKENIFTHQSREDIAILMRIMPSQQSSPPVRPATPASSAGRVRLPTACSCGARTLSAAAAVMSAS